LRPALLLALLLLAGPAPPEPWGPGQAAGPPDTEEAEDAPTAWTPLEPDAGPEWLLVRFERAVAVAEVRVRESLNPGAVRRVSATLEDGSSFLIWEGDDPTATAPADLVVRPDREVVAREVRVELDTTRRPGFNAVDAVELVGRDGSRQWAAEAEASSTYATQGGVLAGELSPEARLFADDKLGIRMRAPGFWIRANPALLDAPGKILRAWTRDGSATIVLLRWETGPGDPALLQERLRAALEEGLGAQVQAREVQGIRGLKAVGLVATGTGEASEGGRKIQQHWIAIPRERDVIVLLLSTSEVSFVRDERTFEKMLPSVVIQGSPAK
jgi:hypothetical protein